MLPLLYLIISVATVERSDLAVTQAAREAGRAFATSDTPAEAEARLAAAVHLALADRGMADDADVRFVAASSSCDGAAVTPRLDPGAEFAICVTRHVDLPALPRFVQGRGITTVGRYVVHVDEYRTVP
jgi:hypothetical protein